MPDDSSPATKKDLNELRDEMRGQMHEMRDEMRGQMGELRGQITGEMHELRDQLIEKMRDMQTEVLRAFHDWAQPVEIKLQAIPRLDERLGLVEERLRRLEGDRLQH